MVYNSLITFVKEIPESKHNLRLIIKKLFSISNITFVLNSGNPLFGLSDNFLKKSYLWWDRTSTLKSGKKHALSNINCRYSKFY